MKKALFFSATCCGQCKAWKPKFIEASEKYMFPFEVINCDEDEERAERFGIKNIPYIVVINTETGEEYLRGVAADVIPLLPEVFNN